MATTCTNCGCSKPKCGCQDTMLTTPAPCPTPIGCPTPEPCAEVMDAQCVIYTGTDIICDVDTVVESNTSVSEALQSVVDYFCTHTGVPQIAIPQLNVQTQGGKLVNVSLLPGTHSDEYLNHNPKIFLFVKKNGRYRKVKDANGNRVKKYYKGGWKHTSHLNGINFPNSNLYSGATNCPTHSEFPLTITNPYQWQLLNDFNPGEFYHLVGTSNTTPAPVNGTELWSSIVDYEVRGKKGDYANRSVYFRFAIGIENPDTTSPFPIVFGPMSASIQCKLVKEQNESGSNYVVSYALNNDPTNIFK